MPQRSVYGDPHHQLTAATNSVVPLEKIRQPHRSEEHTTLGEHSTSGDHSGSGGSNADRGGHTELVDARSGVRCPAVNLDTPRRQYGGSPRTAAVVVNLRRFATATDPGMA
ncbi:Uncharacterised protein [Mycobacteroides abscessus subsp. abscessus]|nr:Uncharacterised protein [Mycobacteroides abscessus subsp. abscessus]